MRAQACAASWPCFSFARNRTRRVRTFRLSGSSASSFTSQGAARLGADLRRSTHLGSEQLAERGFGSERLIAAHIILGYRAQGGRVGRVPGEPGFILFGGACQLAEQFPAACQYLGCIFGRE